jgi:hypothetical protein
MCAASCSASPGKRSLDSSIMSEPRERRLPGNSVSTSIVPARISMPIDQRNEAILDRRGSWNIGFESSMSLLCAVFSEKQPWSHKPCSLLSGNL